MSRCGSAEIRARRDVPQGVRRLRDTAQVRSQLLSLPLRRAIADSHYRWIQSHPGESAARPLGGRPWHSFFGGRVSVGLTST